MSRIRTIKPEFFTSEDIGSLTVNSRLLYVALWCQADRDGRMKFQRISLAAQCMPFEFDQFDECLDELLGAGLIRMYAVNNKKYLDIPTFTEHQRPHHTEKPSKIPEFNGALTVNSTLNNASETVKERVDNRKEREREREREREKEKISLVGQTETDATDQGEKPETPSPAKPSTRELNEQARQVLAFLNEKTGRNYQDADANLKLITSRMKEGATVMQCRQVIVRKWRDWGTDETMAMYLRPKTLFNKTNFAQYIGELVAPVVEQGGTANG